MSDHSPSPALVGTSTGTSKTGLYRGSIERLAARLGWRPSEPRTRLLAAAIQAWDELETGRRTPEERVATRLDGLEPSDRQAAEALLFRLLVARSARHRSDGQRQSVPSLPAPWAFQGLDPGWFFWSAILDGRCYAIAGSPGGPYEGSELSAAGDPVRWIVHAETPAQAADAIMKDLAAPRPPVNRESETTCPIKRPIKRLPKRPMSRSSPGMSSSDAPTRSAMRCPRETT